MLRRAQKYRTAWPSGIFCVSCVDLFEPHQFVAENPLVHQLEILCDDRAYRHMGADVLFKINARGDLDQLQPLGGEPEDRPLGEVHHRDAAVQRGFGAEGDLLDRGEEFINPALLIDHQLTVFNMGLEPAGGEGAAEEDLLGVLADVDKTTAAGQLGTELRDVDVARAVSLGKAQIGLKENVTSFTSS